MEPTITTRARETGTPSASSKRPRHASSASPMSRVSSRPGGLVSMSWRREGRRSADSAQSHSRPSWASTAKAPEASL